MDLLSYLRVLRRRWVVVLAVIVAGGTVGALSGLLKAGAEEGGRYFKANHLLALDTNNGINQQPLYSNLDQIALQVTSGDVPKRVGTKLGQDGQDGQALARRVIVTTDSATTTLEITAVGRDAAESEQIANAFATQLIASINSKAQRQFTTERDDVLARLDKIEADINTFDADIAKAGITNPDIIKARRDSLANQYRLTYEQFQQLADRGRLVSGLSTLESARAIPIGTTEYQARLARGAAGEQLIRASDQNNSGVSGGSSGATFQGPMSRGLLGAFLGLLGGIGLALVIERLDRRLRSRQDVEAAFGAPVLAEIPRLTRSQKHNLEVLSQTAPLSRSAEAHRAVRSSLLFEFAGLSTAGGNGDGHLQQHLGAVASFMAPDSPETARPLVVLVTSARSSEGKTTTAANLAAVFAESGASVLAVNCDFRRPTLHKYLGAPNESRRVLTTAIPGVSLVAGVLADPAANPAQIVAAQRQVVTAARERFDIVILDTAPLLSTNDAIEIVSSADLVVVVARSDVTTHDSALRVRELLERMHAPVAGIVFVADESVPNDYYYYYHRHPEGAEPPPPGTKQAPAAARQAEGASRDLFPVETTGSTGEKPKRSS